MAHIETHSVTGQSILRAIKAPFDAIGNFLIALAEASSRSEQAEYLHSLSDAELAERGLKREDIAHEVFKDAYYL